ncbi:MAG: hypothetical protein EP340_11240 [Alphaproteobacteria bacterium]|nr:MAG: hypothetical protein EP340_11240 [Alphaproteobacteria bacterium]
MSEQTALSPFEDIRNLISQFPEEGEVPLEISDWICHWRDLKKPKVERPLVAVYASVFGTRPEAEREKLATDFAALEAGQSNLARLAGELGAGLRAFDLAMRLPSPDVADAPSFDEQGCAATIAFGMEVIAADADLIILRQAGLGSDAAAALVAAAFTGEPVEGWTFGDVSPEIIAPSETDPLAILARLGSRELAAHLGALIAARHMRVPVFLDGPTAAVAAMLLEALAPGGSSHGWLTDPGTGPGAERLLARFPRRPIFALEDAPSGGLLTLGLLRS